MKRLLLGALALLLALVAAGIFWFGGPQGPRLADVAHLRAPRLATHPDQTVLAVRATGDPDTVGKEAFGLLMKSYFSLSGVPRPGAGMPAPRARWFNLAEAPRDAWSAEYAIPVPDSVTSLAEGMDGVELVTWRYGRTVEILHVGPYDREAPTVERLMRFADSLGVSVVGPHEEEYLRGPGMLRMGDPETYLTMLRYRVAEPDSASG